MTLSIISAMTKNNVIGANNGLPWTLPDDWKRLIKMVKDKDIVMGRKTYDSHDSILSERRNYIFSTQENLELPDHCVQVKDIHSFLDNAQGEVFILGGGEIYNLMLPHCHRMHLTLIETELEGDTIFPNFDADQWLLESSIYHPADDHHKYGFYFNSYIRNPKSRIGKLF